MSYTLLCSNTAISQLDWGINYTIILNRKLGTSFSPNKFGKKLFKFLLYLFFRCEF